MIPMSAPLSSIMLNFEWLTSVFASAILTSKTLCWRIALAGTITHREPCLSK